MNTPLLTDREENMAPWNQEDPKQEKIKITASITLSKTFDIFVDKSQDNEISEIDIQEAAQQYIEDYIGDLEDWDIDDFTVIRE